ncbi:hypothetical protein BO78DRAFT_189802 [Aspergillus sclerotiicarbonarius CBS 121057]|uniref:Uncharacterized protein n=1 Tax=Aspergillus sclerotiicarbonarius (strain CBS 121057 / IBT 28362) TaxID=1448318 RepID=A0A319E119_ASPSB|nr:hypothetical protein BO78DRAFT_189802 [Aspergillus sclerotiicarbonarius CBS 121057]
MGGPRLQATPATRRSSALWISQPCMLYIAASLFSCAKYAWSAHSSATVLLCHLALCCCCSTLSFCLSASPVSTNISLNHKSVHIAIVDFRQ